MTPANWLFSDLLVAGAAWMFGGLLLGLAVGVVVGWRSRSFARGAGAGLLLWGLGNLAVAGMATTMAYHDTLRSSLAVTRCEARGGDDKPFHRLTVGVPTLTGPRELTLAWRDGGCPTDAGARAMVRLRKASLAGPGPVVGALEPDDEASAIIAVWGVLGCIGVLLGTTLVRVSRSGKATATGTTQRTTGTRATAANAALPAWRREIHHGLGWLGLGLMVAAFVGPAVMDGSVERSMSFAFRSAAAAMVCWFVGSAAAGALTVGSTVGWLTVGGFLMGLAEVLRLMA